MFSSFRFFFNDTATTEIYTLSLHDALPILVSVRRGIGGGSRRDDEDVRRSVARGTSGRGEDVGQVPRPGAEEQRSEEHTSELQSRQYLVCRLLLEKKK